MEKGYKTVMLNPVDSVAVALSPIPAGAAVEVSCRGRRFTVVLRDAVEFGHKFAVVPIRKGQDVRKYGEVIGAATRDIRVGEHVHVHNVEGKRGRGDRDVRGKSS
ncbi:UxaA family hydrolase [Planifilum fimeticola]